MKITCTADDLVTLINGAPNQITLREATAEDVALALTGIADMDIVTRRKYLEVARTLNRLLTVNKSKETS